MSVVHAIKRQIVYRGRHLLHTHTQAHRQADRQTDGYEHALVCLMAPGCCHGVCI